MLQLLRNLFCSHSKSGSEVELSRTIHLAFQLARESGRTVALGLEPGKGCLAPRFRGGISFGVPKGIPLPQGTLDPRWAQIPKALRVSPWHTATEGMWFMQDQQGPLCMHLTAKGSLRFLRFQTSSRRWCLTKGV
jgi:hypothetical protein